MFKLLLLYFNNIVHFIEYYLGFIINIERAIISSCLNSDESAAKELSLCHKLLFSNHYIFGTKCRRPYIFQTMNSVKSNNLSLKYQMFTTSGSKDIGVYIFEFVPKV